MTHADKNFLTSKFWPEIKSSASVKNNFARLWMVEARKIGWTQTRRYRRAYMRQRDEIESASMEGLAVALNTWNPSLSTFPTWLWHVIFSRIMRLKPQRQTIQTRQISDYRLSIVEDSHSFEEEFYQRADLKNMKAGFERLVSHLSKRDQQVLLARYRGVLMEEIASTMKLSRAGVSVILRRFINAWRDDEHARIP